MRLLTAVVLAILSLQSFAQKIPDFNGDYSLVSEGNCNSTARVDISKESVSILNQDVQPLGWSSINLKFGVLRSSEAGYETIKTVSIRNSDVTVETFLNRPGERSHYQKDLYSFSEKNGRKFLIISFAELKCNYEKK